MSREEELNALKARYADAGLWPQRVLDDIAYLLSRLERAEKVVSLIPRDLNCRQTTSSFRPCGACPECVLRTALSDYQEGETN